MRNLGSIERKKMWHCWKLLALWIAVLSSPLHAAEQPTRTILVLDASGSMWGQIEGRAKIEIAREVIAKLVDDLPANTELGLVTYGHRRKGDCEDIELLVEPGKLDREAFKKTVNAIQPKGMTPLTDAVEFAAEKLRSTENKATVILVTDGEETCDRDPCEAARLLEASGVDFTAHVVAFDLDDKAAKSVECLAATTGGLFLKADNATTLADALQMVIEPEPEQPKMEDPGEASVTGPKTVVAGSRFEVTWTGPGEKGDYITIVPKDLEDGAHRNYEYTRGGSPLEITALIAEGPAELRYQHGRTGKVLARADIAVVAAEVTLNAAESVVAGAQVTVEWTGPDNKGDYITVVPKDLEDGKYAQYTYTREGSPLKVLVPIEAGDAEIRYMTGQGNKVLARIPLKLEAAEATLKAAESVVAGAQVTIEWTGPDNERDYITVVPKDLEDGKYAKYTYTSEGSPLKVLAPIAAGDAEIRYMTGQDNKVLARIPLKLEAAEVTLKAAESVVAGAEVTVEWTGPDNERDYITIVPKDLEDGNYAQYTYTSEGSPLKVLTPIEPGDTEIRYMTGQDNKVLARIPLKLEAAVVTLKAAESVVAGAEVTVEWTGPDNKRDYITVVPKDLADGEYAEYTYTSEGSPLKVSVPDAAGDAEIRYMTGQGNKVLARIPLRVEEGQ
ncbi:MAG: VWA domain-containing protein [Verrucomicrobiaceae bacterium]|nr:VWA domain-containing protein [Verrucomicrobiaceae bacterium]